MTHSTMHMIKAHLPVILDYFGLATSIALIVYTSKGFVEDHASPTFAVVYASLVIGHFLVPVARRTPAFYGVLLLIGIVSTIFYAVDLVHNECGYQVIIGRPRDVHLPTVPPKHPKHSPLPTDAWLQCTDVAGAWWLNLILTLYVDFVFAVSLLQRSSHGRIRLPDTDTEAGSAPA